MEKIQNKTQIDRIEILQNSNIILKTQSLLYPAGYFQLENASFLLDLFQFIIEQCKQIIGKNQSQSQQQYQSYSQFLSLYYIKLILSIIRTSITLHNIIIKANHFQPENHKQNQMSQTKIEVGVQSLIDFSKNTYLKQVRENSVKQNCMPFLFRSKRQFPFNNQQKNQVPPVGSYNIKDCFMKNNDKNIEAQMKKYQVLNQQLERQMTMGIFKSSQQRFKNKFNEIPGPTHYDSIKTITTKSRTNNAKTRKQALIQKLSSLKRSGPSCPAIPSSFSKFGYSKTKDGQLQQVKKTQQILKLQKQKLKKYVLTLAGQNNYDKKKPFKSLFHYSYSQNKQIKILSEQFVKDLTVNNNSKVQEVKQKKIEELKESRHGKNTQNFNKFKLMHHVESKKKYDQNLGPGCYDVKLNTLKLKPKKQQFQFFGSTQMRFKQLSQFKSSQAQNPYEHIFTQIKDNINIQRQNGKLFKKSAASLICPRQVYKKIDQPGPGYYEANPLKIRKSNGNIKFSQQQRFRQPERQLTNGQAIQEYEYVEQIKNNSIERSKKGFWSTLKKQRMRGQQKQYQPVRQQEIYGIMNDEPIQNSILQTKNFNNKQNSNKGTAVFLDKSKRFDALKTAYNRDNNDDRISQKQLKLKQESERPNKVTGCYMSRLPKQDILTKKEKSPGPGEYNSQLMGRKSFTLKKK